MIPLDELRGWRRYHHLFADLLRGRLRQEQPGRLTQLHSNAAAWYEHHGLADDAIGHAAAASHLINVPALTTLNRSYLAQLHGDAEAAAVFAAQTLAESKPEERALSATAQGFLAVAEWLRGRLYETASGQDRAGSLIEIGALLVLARATTGDEAGAVAALAQALLLACPQGYVRVFADEGPPMAALLGRLIAAQRTGSGFQAAAGVPLGYLARLQRAFDAASSTPDHRLGAAAVQGIVDPLTSRELEVLTMLAAGRSNQAIASELVVTLDTVKKHVSHLLGKLSAANRGLGRGPARSLPWAGPVAPVRRRRKARRIKV